MCADLLKLEVDLLFFDTASTSSVTSPTPPASTTSRRSAPTATARTTAQTCPKWLSASPLPRGHPGQGVGLARQHNDMSVIGEVKDDLRGWRLGRVVTVVDRGFSSDENLRYAPAGTGSLASACAMAPRRASRALAPRPLPIGPGEPPRQGSPRRPRRRRGALHRLPQPPAKPTATKRNARTRSPASRPSSSGSRPPARTRRTPRPWRSTAAPSAPCAITPPAGC